MKVSLNWLKDYVNIEMDIKDLVNLLTMGGLEVEEVISVGGGFEKVLVGEIQAIRRHPNADRLSLVEVSISKEKFSIVCGATNIREGQKVPLALVGAKLPNGMEIRRSTIRGEVSEGMLCSEAELGLGGDATGIMILDPDIPLGVNLGEALGLIDSVLEISITPNRPDCLCIIGVAREIAALTNQRVRYPSIYIQYEDGDIHQRTSVTILDPHLCPRYVAKMIEGVKIGPSPFWIRNRLEKIGVRSINNVVDVTNYVMMEFGQPLHAFDFELLEDSRIVVRRAKKDEEFVTLDGVKRILDDDMLMICDGIKPVAIAGVMGGLNSEIRDDTRIVLLESAYFNPINNRSTSKRLGLETEAAYRFGRGVDYGGCLRAADRAAQMIQELAGGRVLGGSIDAYPLQMEPRPIRLNIKKVHNILGREIPPSLIKTYLSNLELKVEEEDEDNLKVLPPSFRGDLEREIDLVEEVARIDGYDKIPLTLPKGPPSSEERIKGLSLEKKISDIMVHHGFYEVVTYSFTSPRSYDFMGLKMDDPRRNYVQILNPLNENLSVMRTSLIPGLLETAHYNLSWKNTDIKIYEIKKVFLPKKGERLPREVKFLSGVAIGADRDIHWSSPQRQIDFYDVKGCVEDIFDALRIKEIKFRRAEDIPYLHPGKGARIFLGEEVLGELGEVHPTILDHFEINREAYIFEINFELLVEYADETKRFQSLPKFPAVYRDLSIVIDEALEVGMIEEAIWDLRQPFIDDVQIFDVYQGAPIPQGKKGVSFRIRYQAKDRTMTDEEVNRYHEEVTSRLREIFKVELRQ